MLFQKDKHLYERLFAESSLYFYRNRARFSDSQASRNTISLKSRHNRDGDNDYGVEIYTLEPSRGRVDARDNTTGNASLPEIKEEGRQEEAVQYSVFECFLSLEEMRQLFKKSKKLVKPSEDNVRFYWIAQEAVERVLTIGSVEPTSPPKYYVI